MLILIVQEVKCNQDDNLGLKKMEFTLFYEESKNYSKLWLVEYILSFYFLFFEKSIRWNAKSEIENLYYAYCVVLCHSMDIKLLLWLKLNDYVTLI